MSEEKLDQLKKQLSKFVDDVYGIKEKPKGEALKKFIYGKSPEWIVEFGKKTDKDFSNTDFVLTDESIIHCRNKHGIIADEIKQIIEISFDPNYAATGFTRGKDNPEHSAFSKEINGKTYLVINRYFPQLDELRVATIQVRNKQLNEIKFKNILGMNSKTDIAKAIFTNKDKIKRGLEAPEANRNSTINERLPTAANSAKTSTKPSINNIPKNGKEVNEKNDDFA